MKKMTLNVEYEAVSYHFSFLFPDGTKGSFDYCWGCTVSPEEADKLAKAYAEKFRSFGFSKVKYAEF